MVSGGDVLDQGVLRIPIRFKKGKSGIVLEGAGANGSDSTRVPDPTLVKNLARAYRWRELLEKGEMTSIDAIAKSIGCTPRYVRKLLPLAFLAPDIIDAILEGRHPRGLGLSDLLDPNLALSWPRQRELLGFAPKFAKTIP